MTPGELATYRGDGIFYWLPQSFIKKHWFAPYQHTRKTVQKEGGMIIKANSKLNKVPVCYGCTDCNIIVMDCE